MPMRRSTRVAAVGLGIWVAACGERAVELGFWFEPVSFTSPRLGEPVSPAEFDIIEKVARDEIAKAFASLAITVTADRDARYKVVVVAELKDQRLLRRTGTYAGESRAVAGFGGSGAVNFEYVANGATVFLACNTANPTPYPDWPDPATSDVTLKLFAGGGSRGHLNLGGRPGAPETLTDDPSVTALAAMNSATHPARLLYATNALTRDVRLSGTPRASLSAAFSKPKANLSVYLVSLPETGWNVRVATTYVERGAPGDRRLAIEPDVRVDLTSSDYFGRRDPVLARAFRGL